MKLHIPWRLENGEFMQSDKTTTCKLANANLQEAHLYTMVVRSKVRRCYFRLHFFIGPLYLIGVGFGEDQRTNNRHK